MLFLASSSSSRAYLLEISKIPFALLSHSADERCVSLSLPVSDYVLSVALLKMAHVKMPESDRNIPFFYILTADTMSVDHTGTLVGKPATRLEAHRMIKNTRAGAYAYTAFCIEKRTWTQGRWMVVDQHQQVVKSAYVIDIPDIYIDFAIDAMNSMQSAGAAIVERFGMQFVKEVRGSYSNIMGLPLFEVRQALDELDFSFEYSLA